MSALRKVVHLDDPRCEPDAILMEFRLTYAGLLYSTANDSGVGKKADHKHELRMAFHPQLKRLWEVTPFLKNGEGTATDMWTLKSGDNVVISAPSYKPETLATKHALYGWNFVPLVTKELDLWCGIDVLFLRPGKPGKLINQGDVDGRLKTILDALAIPDANQGYESRNVARGHTYTLLEDDRLISKVSVETDELLDIGAGELDENFVRLLITVNIRPYEMRFGNMQFG